MKKSDKILDLIDRAIGNRTEVTLQHRIENIAKELGVELTSPNRREHLKQVKAHTTGPSGHVSYHGSPTAKMVFKCCKESGTGVIKPCELEKLRGLSAEWEAHFALLIRDAPTSENVSVLVAQDAKLHGQPEYRALDRVSAKALIDGHIRELKQEIKGITAKAQPIITAVAARVRAALETRLDSVLRTEIASAAENFVPFSPSVLVTTIELALSRLDSVSELPPDGHPARGAVHGVLDLILAEKPSEQPAEKPK